MTSKVLCRYHMHGACRYGDSCAFSHDTGDAPSMVCKYYLAGNCLFGDNCRYDHVRPEYTPQYQQRVASSRAQGQAPPAVPPPVVDNRPVDLVAAMQRASLAPLGVHESAYESAYWSAPGFAAASHAPRPPATWAAAAQLPEHSASLPGSSQPSESADSGNDSDDPWGQRGVPSTSAAALAADEGRAGLCQQYAASGACLRGGRCPLVHGDLCPTCGKYCLHPSDAAEREAHSAECERRHARLEARRRSAHVECGICLELVLAKQNVAARKFGLLACDHAYCLECIRSWRGQTDSAADVDAALRTCPVCRTVSHFVTPSSTWPASPEEKALIMDGYRAKLRSIDCKYYALGEGTCPFGTSCFYRHVDRDGRPEEVSLRKIGTAEGEVKVVRSIRLSDFLDTPGAQRALRRR